MVNMIPQEVIDFILGQWGNFTECDVRFPPEIWQDLCDKAYRDLGASSAANPHPFCIRLVGQSGSGKSSQLLPSVQSALDKYHYPFVIIAVRNFVPYHPHVEAIKQQYNQGIIREKTNAFALILLTMVLIHCIEQQRSILLDMTLLAPKYEQMIHRYLQAHHYACDYQCMAIRKEVSDAWIAERCRETGRVVEKSSSGFFYNTLEPAFTSLQAFASMTNRVIIWDRAHPQPMITQLGDKQLWEKFTAARQVPAPFLNFDDALASKKAFLHTFYSVLPSRK